MATKKPSTAKKQSQKAGAKKIAAVKVSVKKVSIKKISIEKNDQENSAAGKDSNKKTAIKTTLTTAISPSIVAINTPQEIPVDTNCICMQKKPNGNFYNFTLQQGRWVQSVPAIPFPTKEACEEACC
jgi:hypothetical protein